MRRVISLLVLGTILVLCGSNDLQSKLRELESQRDELNAQIADLKKEIEDNNGD